MVTNITAFFTFGLMKRGFVILVLVAVSFCASSQTAADSAYQVHCQKILEAAILAFPDADTATISLMKSSFDCPVNEEDFTTGFDAGEKAPTLRYVRFSQKEEVDFCERFAYEKYGVAFVQLDSAAYSDAYVEGFNLAMRTRMEYILGYDADSVGVVHPNCQEVFRELEKQLSERFTVKESGRGYYIYRINLKYFPVKSGFNVTLNEIQQTTSLEKLEMGVLYKSPEHKDSAAVSITFTLREPELPINRSAFWLHGKTLNFSVAVEPKHYK